MLASESPRRKSLLRSVGICPIVVPSGADESVRGDLRPEELVKELAGVKVQTVSRDYPDDLVLGADTVVCLDGRVMGKPSDRDEAIMMLRRLSGNDHIVYTGVALYDPATRTIRTDYDGTIVRMRDLEDEVIRWYVDTGEPMDKAGAYALQGAGAFLVQRIEGDYTGVIGLPLPKVFDMLRDAGVRPSDLLRGSGDVVAAKGASRRDKGSGTDV